jgi:hypothetical protein
MAMMHKTILDVLLGGLSALAAAQCAGYLTGFASAYYEGALCLFAAPLIGLAAGFGGRLGAGGRRGLPLQTVCALAAMSGCMVAIYMWLYACEQSALYRATRIDRLPPSALFIGPDLKFQWNLWWIFLKTGGLFLNAWIFAGAVAATVPAGEPVLAAHGTSCVASFGVAFFLSMMPWSPMDDSKRIQVQTFEDRDPVHRSFEAAWFRLNANPLEMFIDALERRTR